MSVSDAQQLADAAMADDADTVRLLLAEEPGLANEYTDEGWTPLHLAAANGRLKTARMLLEAGASTNVRTEEATGLRWAQKTPLELLAVPDRTGEGGTPARPEVDEEMTALLRQYGAAS